ncbi:MAG: iron-sulfur cluster assembly accessory protein [Methanomassiliicoccaceae archaeon]|nr:iron-sulfur cluster assembly accessory protein [Methanomassiliicoccaceae archaeon]
MVTITPDAEKFISELLEKNKKAGYGVKIYFAGMACSGPQFGMSFQEKAEDGDVTLKLSNFSLFYDAETAKELDECIIEFIDDPNFGTGLTINNPNIKGCATCGSGKSGCS